MSDVEIYLYHLLIAGSNGRMASGSLKRALFVFGVTGYAVMSSAGN
jgi:hypothetical protein